MDAWLDVHKELPGLQGQHLHAVNVAAEQLVAALSSHGFKVFVIDGSKITSKSTFFEQAGQALQFPNNFGRNWDAFEDSLSELRWRAERRVAIVWKRAYESFAMDAQVFLDAITTFDRFAFNFRAYPDQGSEPLQMEVFLLGQEKGFNVRLDLEGKP